MSRVRSSSQQRRVIATSLAAALFVGITFLQFLWGSDQEPLLLLSVVPVALVAAEFGLTAGIAAGLMTYAAWFLHGATTAPEIGSAGELVVRAIVSILPGGLIGWLADKEHEAQREVRDSERQLRFIAEESSDMISTHSPDGRYRFVSDRCRSLLGYEPRELVGRMAYELVHPGDHEDIAASHAAVLGTDDVASVVYRIEHREGHHVWVESRSRARRDPATGTIEEIHCATRDVTDQHLAAAKDAVRIAVVQERVEGLLATSGLHVVYQPIKNLHTGRTIALEALARFPNGRPDVWFNEAWEAGLGLDLELLAIRTALDPPGGGLPEGGLISLNASPATVQSPALIDALGEHAHRTVIEVTEHAVLTDVDAFKAARARLREHGIQLAIDDVGSGFSGLQRLLDFEPDILKLDLSLSRDIDRDPKRRALASALIAFGESADMLVIAEGIETAKEVETLRDLGIGFGQGYHLAMPDQLHSDRLVFAPARGPSKH
jgi:PAS domain S-box-containing protein